MKTVKCMNAVRIAGTWYRCDLEFQILENSDIDRVECPNCLRKGMLSPVIVVPKPASRKTVLVSALLILILLGYPSFAQSQLRVNVESFGAVADGNTDNTNAINSALKSMHAGQTLAFPCSSGQSYLVKSPINFGAMKSMSIEGSGPGCFLQYQNSSSSAPYAFSFVGAWLVDVRNMDFWSTPWGIAPETVLMLGRPNSSTASGAFKFENVRVEGFATKAVVYSIASEENQWLDPTIILNGGGALHGFYTSASDDLGIANLPTASNLSLWLQNFHVMDFSPSIDPTHALIADIGNSSAAGNHTYRDGYLASGGGTAFEISSPGSNSIAWMGMTIDSNRFENGYQMFNFTGGGSFGDISLTNNKSDGSATKYMINLPTTCYDCTFEGNNIGQGESTISVVGILQNSRVSENYPFFTTSQANSEIFNRQAGTLQLGATAKGSCSAATEGTISYFKQTHSMQICQGSSSGNYSWVSK